jgi:hypothetical protein
MKGSALLLRGPKSALKPRWASLNMTVAEMPGLFGLKPTQKEEAWIGCI